MAQMVCGIVTDIWLRSMVAMERRRLRLTRIEYYTLKFMWSPNINDTTKLSGFNLNVEVQKPKSIFKVLYVVLPYLL